MAVAGNKPADIVKKLPHLNANQIAQKLYTLKKQNPDLKLLGDSKQAENEDGNLLLRLMVSLFKKAYSFPK
jgi:hypothetical protein